MVRTLRNYQSLVLYISLAVVVSAEAAAAGDCTVGAYRAPSPPWGDCAGYRTCEPGHFCIDGIKRACAPGLYGNVSGLASSTCSGMCPAGYHCPQGSINPIPCGSPLVYCPAGSSEPLRMPIGHFGIGKGPTLFSSTEICPRGHHCIDGVRYACPSGTYGEQEGLSTEACSGLCPPGWICPAASTNPRAHPCPNDPTLFCPEGSAESRTVGEGWYATESHVSEGGGFAAEERCPPGSVCIGGIRRLCPAGRFGASWQMVNASCSGECEEGFYCPEGSISPNQNMCGDTSLYCPAGSGKPTPVDLGFYTVGSNTVPGEFEDDNFKRFSRVAQRACEAGYYCDHEGVRHLCPPGRYGSTTGLHSQDCSGPCSQGYYCPIGSVSATQHQCGSPAVFCPGGTSEPIPVRDGHYSIGTGLATMHAERKCEPGHFCVGGVRRYCDFGHWGNDLGMNVSTCMGLCEPGHYCPEGSVLPTEVKCGDASKYCPGYGNFRPTVVSKGYYSIGGDQATRYDQRITPAGTYAIDGLSYLCPAGRYGAVEGQSIPECSGECHEGYYCPAGSTSPFMRVCGGDDVICPRGSIAPIRVAAGFYTTDFWAEGCKPGTWRNWTGLSIDATAGLSWTIPTYNATPECELCPAGKFKAVRGDELSLCLDCPWGDAASTPDRMSCECSKEYGGTPLPEGHVLYYNHTSMRCENVRPASVMSIAASLRDLNTSITRYEESPCEPGHYCIGGVMKKCPPGRYGSNYKETSPECEADCPKGYYCPLGTAVATQFPCSRVDLYCPLGSAYPLYVDSGYYTSNEGFDPDFSRHRDPTNIYPSMLIQDVGTRSQQHICHDGHYCIGGVIYRCPRGTYNDREGVIDPQCLGPCDPGYYCPEASSSRRHTACGNSTVYCPRGSWQPSPVHEGFYCEFSGFEAGILRLEANEAHLASTCSAEVPCDPGYYCSGGNRYPCPPGRFGWRYGLNTSECSGMCAAGYYCPSILKPQLDTPPYTQWPGKPQLTAVDYECGGVEWYCPTGSAFPLKVGGGNYSVGGDPVRNTTRRGQEVCPKGWYCLGGVRYPCDRGRYGSTPGLQTPVCTAICPTASYCPEGTAEPLRCPPGHYSDGGAWYCNICPGLTLETAKNVSLPCQDGVSCCFRY